MPKFTAPNKPGVASTQPPSLPQNATDPKPPATVLHSLSNMLRTVSACEWQGLIFHLPEGDAVVATPHATNEDIEQALSYTAQFGATFKQNGGLVWFPPSSIKKVSIIQ